MGRVEILGLGAWSPKFRNWSELVTGLKSGAWAGDGSLEPARIAPRERRRAPQLVRMAVEVMDQACTMAGMEPADVAVVFSSSMGDMEITDYMCRALAGAPKVLSPTRFHNSVHNAAAGYWSIANGAFSPASAVSAFEYTASMALLEAAIQAVEEHTPVILVTQELAAPPLLLALCPSQSPFSAAFLLAPPDKNHSAICSLEFSVSPQSSEWPPIAAELATEFMSNFGARLLPVLTAIATDQLPTSYQFPISEAASLHLALASGRRIG